MLIKKNKIYLKKLLNNEQLFFCLELYSGEVFFIKLLGYNTQKLKLLKRINNLLGLLV
jgi:hypothetical protein